MGDKAGENTEPTPERTTVRNGPSDAEEAFGFLTGPGITRPVIRRVLIVAAFLLAAAAWGVVKHADGGPHASQTELKDLKTGVCVRKAPEGAGQVADAVDVVECTTRHEMEVFARFTVPDGPYPGVTKLKELINTICSKEFKKYIGIAPEDSVLVVGAAYPTKDNWPEDRAVVCAVGQQSGDTAISLKGAGR